MNIGYKALGATACVLAHLAAAQEVAVDSAAVDAARAAFVERMVADHAFDRAEIAATLATVTIDARVLRAIAAPAERVLPWYEYRNIFMTPARIEAGVDFWRDNAPAVEAAARRHGVEPQMLLAIIGVETLFGRRMGEYRVLDALGTLAFAYPPRAAFFADELEAFLLMSREDGPQMLEARGSYAGAMGAGQFIPSSFRAYAVDGDADGVRDVWGNWHDVLASVANYLAEHGWRSGEPIVAAAAKGPQWTGPEPGQGLALRETVGSLTEMGYQFATDLPPASPAMVFGLESDPSSTEYWVGFRNFGVITRYNRSVKYALAAHQLGEAIRDGYAHAAKPLVQ